MRWRVKDTEHLIEKIIRKRVNNESSEKYRNISAENYINIVTDLIGVRALHLFKDNCFEINDQIRSTWTPTEDQIAYIRKGDDDDFVERLKAAGLIPKEHKATYRSLHYVIDSKPTDRNMRAEIQVRTLFEEGWSEIDHSVRYPNFMNDELLKYFLEIFNRLAGSADEMGGFVKALAETLKKNSDERKGISDELSNAMAKIDATVAKLASSKDAERDHKALISKLQAELSALKHAQNKNKAGPFVLGSGGAIINIIGSGGATLIPLERNVQMRTVKPSRNRPANLNKDDDKNK